MNSIMNNPRFADAFGQLESVTLNPHRHTAAHARAHSEAVREARAQAGIAAELEASVELGHVDGTACDATACYVRRVRYFQLAPAAAVDATREHRWVRLDEARALVGEAVHGVLAGVERHARA